ncbi:TetR family transcriptional regulator [Schaalia turicensis]|uniref:TetR family transcriptional regulator n=1 Tax=Schaalia turicensis TaxID=131111 RepID=A0A2I1I3T2_9ACTO|nr:MULTISPECIES: TetR family transcriptional regulator [Actinomycetaceae]MDK7781046.1 TetR family transcriptional regulator [Actinomycetaceae bacterium UMB8041B]MDK8294407.1 TetR family transcriptional regulator [Actinomycetaceae bacterium UMB8039B]MDK8608376.1 TetR family transcriptional regulator [Actinomycetaceae bacterium UMB8041A]MDK8753845.1 TetR family transcriptional regulator [Actinomycetaceae bacterium UMB8039A]MDK6830043.1 TetR family transcriptional regulator [Pauljensenia sp. UMB8
MGNKDKRVNTGRRAWLTQEKITHTAMELTRECGLEKWSIRDLAQRLGVVPSVIYHHYQNRDAITASVIGEITSTIELPDEQLEWKDWFISLAENVRPVFLEFPGVTDKLMYGHIDAAFIPILEVAYEKLRDAGFNKYIHIAYSIIINTTLWSITARNLRSPTKQEQRHDLGQMITQLQPLAACSTTLTDIIQGYLIPLANPKNEDRMSQEYFEIIIEVVLTGLEIVILPRENA